MCAYGPDRCTTGKTCQMIGFKEGFVPIKIITETNKQTNKTMLH